MTTLSRPKLRPPAAVLITFALACMGISISALAQEPADATPADFQHTWENGCGSGWTDYVVPDFDIPVSASGLITKALNPQNFTSSCNAHDRCWGTLGADRWACDQEFLADLSAACTSTYLPSSNWRSWWKTLLFLDPSYSSQLAACYSQAALYMGAVEAAGAWGSPYDTAQQQANDYQQCSRGQFIASGVAWPWDVIQRALDEGCRVKAVAFGGGWVAVALAYAPEYSQNTMRTSDWNVLVAAAQNQSTNLARPREFTRVEYSNGQWIGVFGDNPHGPWRAIIGGSWDEVMDMWHNQYTGTFISDLEYGDGIWVAVLTRPEGAFNQVVLSDDSLQDLRARVRGMTAGTDSEFPGPWQPWDVEYGDGRWVVTLEKVDQTMEGDALRLFDSFHDLRVDSDEEWLRGSALIDLEYGDGQWASLVGRPQAPAAVEPILGTGDVQVTLRWDAPVDLDLYVLDPTGHEVGIGSLAVPSGGELDVDANAACGGIVANPVENVFWASGEAPRGHYRARVDVYSWCGWTGPINYELSYELNQSGFVVYKSGVIRLGSDAPSEDPLEFDY